MIRTADIIKSLATMTPEQLVEVRTKADAHLAVGGRPVPATAAATKDPDAADVLLALREELFRRGDTSARAIPWKNLRGRVSASNLKYLATYVDRVFKPKTRTDRCAIIRLMVGMTTRNVVSFHPQGATFKTVSEQFPRIGQLVDRKFPGYREAGLLAHVIALRLKTARV